MRIPTNPRTLLPALLLGVACASMPPRAPFERVRPAPWAGRCIVDDLVDDRPSGASAPIDEPAHLKTGDADLPVPAPAYGTLRIVEALREAGLFEEVDRGGAGGGATRPAYELSAHLVALEGDLARTPRWTSCAGFLCTAWLSGLYPSSATGHAALDRVELRVPGGGAPLWQWQVNVRQEAGLQGWGRDRARNAADRALDEALRRLAAALNDALSKGTSPKP